ncbi:MAG: DUF3899 domain-containing protein [Oscillospiraceae bacterium]
MSKNAKMLLIYAGGGLAVAILVAWSQGLFSAKTTQDILRTLSDGFFVTAALLLAFGGLRWCVNGGAVDGLGYTFKSTFQRMKFSYDDQNREGFAEYRQNREKKAKSPKVLFLAGLGFLVIALAFYVSYYAVS